MHCQACDHSNPDSAKFCAQCGCRLSLRCKQCGTVVEEKARFCSECGNRLIPAEPNEAPPADVEDAAERRQLTVMFCDLVGSTRLAVDHDPEDLRVLNQSYRDHCVRMIERYDGYIARYMGDGVLVYFGYPRAHEDDAERAVRAALEIASGMADLPVPVNFEQSVSVRVGIATGPVVVGEVIGEGVAREHDVVGETPNLAARLLGVASENSVVVSDETRKLIGTAFTLRNLGLQELKGFVMAVQAWQIVDAAPVENRFEASISGNLTPFVGREQELSLMLDRWQQSLSGDGQVVLLCGEAGIGKSRITRAARDQIQNKQYTMVRFQCSAFHLSSALFPVVQHLRQAAGIVEGDSADSKLGKLESILNLEDLSAENMMSLYASLLSIPYTDRYPDPRLDADVLRQRILDSLLHQLRCLARKAPLLLLIEDVHWADPTTLEFLGLLVERVQSWQSMLLITYRPEFEAPWTGEPHVFLLSLNRLNRKQCESIIFKLTGNKGMPDEIVEEIARKTDGVPLFIEELTKTILESGLVVEEAQAYVLVGPMQPLAIPTTLQDSLMARLDQLDDAKHLAQIGASIGREFSHALLKAVSGSTDEVLSSPLNRLMESGLVFRRGSGTRTSYLFKHALIQDAAYNSMLKSRRYLLHQNIAEALVRHFPDIVAAEPELLAQHFTAAGLDQNALPHWIAAGKHAMERSAYQESISHFRKGLQASERIDQNAENAAQTVELYILIAECGRVIDQMDEAFSALQSAQDLATKFDMPRYLSRIHYQRGNLYFPMARTKECLAEHESALRYARDADAIEEEVQALGGLGDAYYVRGQMRKASEMFDRCVVLARERHFTETLAANISMHGFSRVYLFELKEALQDGRDAVKFANEVGKPRAVMLGQMMIFHILHYMGKLEESIEACLAAEDTVRRLGASRFEPQPNYFRALSLYRLGDRSTAMQCLEKAEHYARQYSPRFILARVLGGLSVVTDDASQREAALVEGERLLDDGVVLHNHLTFYPDAIDSCFDHQEWGRMNHYAGRLQDLGRAEKLPWCDFLAERGRCLAAWGEGDRSGLIMRQLQDLREKAERVEFHSSLDRMEVALAGKT